MPRPSKSSLQKRQKATGRVAYLSCNGSNPAECIPSGSQQSAPKPPVPQGRRGRQAFADLILHQIAEQVPTTVGIQNFTALQEVFVWALHLSGSPGLQIVLQLLKLAVECYQLVVPARKQDKVFCEILLQLLKLAVERYQLIVPVR